MNGYPEHLAQRHRARQGPAGTYRLSLAPRRLRRGDYRVTADVRRGSEHVVQTLTSRRL